jgi:hypothetical protein
MTPAAVAARTASFGVSRRYAGNRDSSFATDSTLVNFEQIFKTYSPTTQRRVL